MRGLRITETRRARGLRQSQTPAEARLWSKLRNRGLAGHKFGRCAGDDLLGVGEATGIGANPPGPSPWPSPRKRGEGTRRGEGITVLTVTNLQTAYGAAQVLFDISFAVGPGEVVTLSAATAWARPRPCNTIMGLVPPRGGEIVFEGRALAGLAALPDRPVRHRPRARGPAGVPDAHRATRTSSRPRPPAPARRAGRSSASTSCSRG